MRSLPHSQEQPRILQICSSASWGGMEMHVVDLSRLLQARGYRITVLTKPNTPLAQKARSLGLNLIEAQFGKYIQLSAIHRFRQLMHDRRFDILHCHYGKDLWTVVPALSGSNKRIPLILVKHIGTQKRKTDLFHRYLYNRVDMIFANSSVIMRNILETHPISRERVELLHIGIDEKRFFPNSEARRRVRQTFGFEESDFVIGISGRLQRWKGHYEFLDMAAEIAYKYPQTRFMVIGGATVGEEAEALEIKAYAANLNLAPRLIFTGYREDIPDILNALDLFVFPSYAEAYGLALLEAMATGLPVIASNCDGVLDIVEHEKQGILVPPRQSKPLVEAVERFIGNSAFRKRIAKAGFERFQKHFTATKMVERMEEFYWKLLEKKGWNESDEQNRED